MFALKLRLAMLLVLVLIAGAAPGMLVSAQGQSRIVLPLIMAPPPPPQPIRVRGDQLLYISQSATRGIYHLVGEIVNETDSPIFNASVLVALYDERHVPDNTPFQTGGSALLRVIYPGEAIPFDLPYGATEMTRPLVSYETKLQYGVGEAPEVRRLSVLSAAVSAGTPPTIRGELRNDQQVPINFPFLIVAFYDSNDTVMAAMRLRAGPLETILQPGQSLGYSLAVDNEYGYWRGKIFDPSWTIKTFAEGYLYGD